MNIVFELSALLIYKLYIAFLTLACKALGPEIQLSEQYQERKEENNTRKDSGKDILC